MSRLVYLSEVAGRQRSLLLAHGIGFSDFSCTIAYALLDGLSSDFSGKRLTRSARKLCT